MPALTGVTVVCVGQYYFAPYCSMLLARLGADVIKIEAPGGDPYRRLPAADADGTPVQFTMVNAGKRLMRLDLKQPDGQQVMRELAARVDVVVQNLAPGVMDRLGLGYDVLRTLNARLIMASGTGFGSFGPYAGQPAMDLTIQARTAVMSTTGFMDGVPVRTGPSVVDFVAGSHLLGGVLAALYHREKTGLGQHVEVALQDAILPSLASNIAGMVNSHGTIPERTGNRHGGLAVVPYNAYRTTDGWVTLLCPTQAHWERLCDIMEDPDAQHPRFATMAGRSAHPDEVDAIVERWTTSRSQQDVAGLLSGTGIPTAPVTTLSELMRDPHVAARGVLRRMHDERGDWMTLGSPLFLSESPVVEPTRPPCLGADTDTILRDDLGWSDERIADLRARDVI
jgi:crotonobetainyl-CoA:carnitine CoA-transferase CaiB-like acyl-CoA transferase